MFGPDPNIDRRMELAKAVVAAGLRDADETYELLNMLDGFIFHGPSVAKLRRCDDGSSINDRKQQKSVGF